MVRCWFLIAYLAFVSGVHAQSKEGIKEQLQSICALAEQDLTLALSKHDSLKNCCMTEENSVRFYNASMNILDIVYNKGRYQESLEISRACMLFFKDRGLKEPYLNAKKQFGASYVYMGKLDSAETILEEALEEIDQMEADGVYTEESALDFRYEVHANLGVKNAINQDLDKAIRHFTICDSIAVKQNNEDGMATVAGYMGNIYQMTKSHEKALEYFQRSINILVKNENYTMAIVNCDNMANSYRNLGEFTKAKEVLKQGRKYGRLAGDSSSIATNYDINSALFLATKEYEKSKRCLDRAWEIQNELGNGFALIQLKGHFVDYYELTSDFEKMKRSSEELLEMSQDNNVIKYKLIALKKLSRALDSLGVIDEAYNYSKQYHALNDSVNKAIYSEKTAKLEAEFNDAGQKREILQLKTENDLALEKQRRKSLANNVLGAGIAASIIAMMLLGYLIYKLRKSKYRTELQKSELEKSDKEKALLLKELHHRVKNNLQIVSSLLKMQGQAVKDEQAQLAIREGQNRVDAMAMIHKHLYTADELTTVDISSYLERLIRSLAYSYGFNKGRFQLQVDISKEPVDVDVAIPLGLIVNELASNSFKHAFADVELAEMSIALHLDDDKINLELLDNGKGLPEGFKVEDSSSFGLELVQALVSQLKGSIQYHNRKGAFFTVEIQPSKALAV